MSTPTAEAIAITDEIVQMQPPCDALTHTDAPPAAEYATIWHCRVCGGYVLLYCGACIQGVIRLDQELKARGAHWLHRPADSPCRLRVSLERLERL